MVHSAPALAPNLNILINGAPLASQAMAATTDLISATVVEDVDTLSMFTLEFVNWDLLRGEVTWVDHSLFSVGNEVEIQMSDEGAAKTVMVGEITGLEPEFSLDDVPTFTVRGYDRRHRLMRGHQTRSYVKIKDSEIARQIAREAGLTAQVEDTKVTLEYVLQHNQTDLEFLQSRAQRIGYEVFVEHKKLHFRSPKISQAKALTLRQGDSLLSFAPRLSTMDQVGQVEVRGWDIKQKKAIVGKASTGQESSRMGGNTSAAAAVNRAFGKASNPRVAFPVSSQAEADQMALGQFKEMGLVFISGEGQCRGNPDLRAGIAIEILGIGKRFSGLYYVSSVTHTYEADQGYRTDFSVRRNAT
jgi:phage protein D